MCLGYIVSLGGIRFHINPEEEIITKDVEQEEKYPLLIPLIFDIVLGVLIILFVVSLIVTRNANDWDVIDAFAKIGSISSIAYSVIPCLYVPILFNYVHLNLHKAPKADQAEEVKEAPQEEAAPEEEKE